MASCPNDDPRAGYATAAAAMVSLGLAVMVSAVLAWTLTNLRGARADLAKTQMAAQLEGGQLLAAYGILENSVPGRLTWTESVVDTNLDILAEPEADKVNAGTADEGLLRQLGAETPTETTAWFQAQSLAPRPEVVREAQPGELWRECAPSALSYYGRAATAKIMAPHSPVRLGQRARAGEVWRVVVSANGWRDDRLVRITGNGRRPAIVIDRRFDRGSVEGSLCSSLVAAQ
ncbi:hypothetical protein BH11PSE2_BH11PSE2_14270 [soil metagenome]